MKTRLSQAERLQLVGLLALAAHHNKQLEELKGATVALLNIGPDDETQFNNPADHVSDAVYGSTTCDELLARLSIALADTDEEVRQP